MSSKLTQLLQDLRAALLESVLDSQRVRAIVSEIRQAGLAIYLVLDDPSSEEEPEALRLTPEEDEHGDQSPSFRIDHSDLTILRGLGIDPTRTLRGSRRTKRK